MSLNLVDTFSEFKSMKNIDRPTMVRVLEDVFRTLIKKKFGSDDNFDVIVNTNGDIESVSYTHLTLPTIYSV